MSEPTPDYYNKVYRDILLDPNRIAIVYGMTDHMLFSALKKILAAGQRGAKDRRQDVREAIGALHRCLEVMDEDEPMKTTEDVR